MLEKDKDYIKLDPFKHIEFERGDMVNFQLYAPTEIPNKTLSTNKFYSARVISLNKVTNIEKVMFLESWLSDDGKTMYEQKRMEMAPILSIKDQGKLTDSPTGDYQTFLTVEGSATLAVVYATRPMGEHKKQIDEFLRMYDSGELETYMTKQHGTI